MLRRFRPLLLLGAALAVFAVFLTGCAGDEASTAVGSGTVVLDVRTPGEYADGHLEGARNIDLQSETFDSEIAALDPDAEYVVLAFAMAADKADFEEAVKNARVRLTRYGA